MQNCLRSWPRAVAHRGIGGKHPLTKRSKPRFDVLQISPMLLALLLKIMEDGRFVKELLLCGLSNSLCFSEFLRLADLLGLGRPKPGCSVQYSCGPSGLRGCGLLELVSCSCDTARQLLPQLGDHHGVK